MAKKLLLIDGNALLYRAFFAFPPLTTPAGEPIGAVYGFCRVLFSSIRSLEPTHVATAFDLAGPTIRHELYDQYKATRQKMPEDLYVQVDKMHTVVNEMEIPVFTEEGYEADDLIGTLAKQAAKEGFEVVILSGDQDLLQLVDENIKVYSPGNSKKPGIMFDPSAVKTKYGFTPEQMIDYKALRGDPSDNIPGVTGIGEVGAKDLLIKFITLHNLYEQLEKDPENIDIKKGIKEKLLAQKDQAYLSYELATIITDSPVEFVENTTRLELVHPEKLVGLFHELGFKSLIAELPKTHKLLSETASLFELEEPTVIANDTVIASKAKQSRDLEIATDSTNLRNDNGVMPDSVPASYNDEDTNLSISEKTDIKLAPILRKMEETGIKIDKPYLEDLQKEFSENINLYKSQLVDLAGQDFNPDSPSQVGHIFYDILHIPTTYVRKGKTGYSTDATTLLELSEQYPIATLLLKYRQITKLLNTYIIPLQELADENDRIHTTYAPDTSTGRISSKNPNLQNIPSRSDLGLKIRQAFITQPPLKLLSVDYSQIELRLAAHFSNDETMLNIFKNKGDIHTTTAEKMGVDRRTAKIINFSILYGKGAYGFAQDMSIPMKEAAAYIENYFKTYAGLKTWMDQTLTLAKQQGYTESFYDKRRLFPEINSTNFQRRSAAEREAINTIIQGTAADILKIAMCRVDQEITKLGLKSRMLLTVHDELIFEYPGTEYKRLTDILQECMVKEFFFKVPLEINIKTGVNWSALK